MHPVRVRHTCAPADESDGRGHDQSNRERDDDVDVASALAASCAVAIQRMRLLEDLLAKQRMERELEVARDIQTRVLPKTMPDIPGYEIAGWSRAADQTGGLIWPTADDVILAAAAVPEPATLLLMASGLVGLAAFIRNKRRDRGTDKSDKANVRS